MKTKMIAVSFVCLFVSMLAMLAPTAASFAQNAASGQEETKLKSIMTTYYDLYQKKDLAGMKELWSARSPARNALIVSPASEYNFSNLNISRIEIEHDSAKLRLSVDRTVSTRVTASGQAGMNIDRRHDVRLFVFLKENNDWRIWRETPAAIEFATELILLAKTDADAEKMLDENKDLIGKELCRELTNSANSYLANGDPATALKGFSRVLMVSNKMGDDTEIAPSQFMIGFILVMQGKSGEAIGSFEDALSSYQTKSDKAGMRTTLYNLGNAFYMQSLYNKAIPSYQRALKLSEDLKDREEMGNAALGLALVFRQMNDEKRALEYYLMAISNYEASGGTLALPEAETGAAAIYYQQRDYVSAVNHYKKALAVLESYEKNADKEKIANVLTNLANSFYQLGDYSQAFDTYQRCLTVGKAIPSKEWQAVAEEGMGLVLMMQGSYQNSLEHYGISLALNKETSDKAGLLRVFSGIGDVYRQQNSNALAIGYYKQALSLATELKDKNSTARLLSDSGLAFGAQGLYPVALDYHQQSFALYQELHDQAGVARSLGNQGGVYFAHGNYPMALEAFQKSLPILESTGDAAGVATVLRGIGLVGTAQGNYPMALESYSKSLKLFESQVAKSDIAIDLVDIGITLGLQGDYKQSLDNELRAQAIATEIGNRDTLWNAQFRAGDAYRHLDQLPQARQSFDDAIKTIEEMRSQVISPIEMSAITANKCAPYLAMVDMLIGQNRAPEALAYAERAKSQTLLDVLAQSGVSIDKGMTAQQREQQAIVKRDSISLITQIIREKQREKPDQNRLDNLEKLRQQKQTEYTQFQSKLNLSNPYLRVLRGDQRPIRPEDSGRLLPDASTVLLDYVVTDANTYLFMISRSTAGTAPRIESVVLNASRSVLAEKIGSLRSAMEKREDGIDKQGQELFAALVGPAKERLTGKTSVIVIPDDSLWYLPFQALMSSEKRYLIEDFDVSYAPSLTALDEMKKLRARNTTSVKPRTTLLALGDPILNQETKDRINLFEPNRNWLQHSEEVRQLKELGLLYGTVQSRILAQSEATERNAKTEAGKFKYLQFAAGGTINDAAPMHSYVALAKGEPAENEDGLMESGEILSLDLRSDLVILSGSKVAGTQSSNGKGLLGLSWAFFVGGCSDVLVSQWQVDSSASTDLIVSFHKKLKNETRPGVISKTWRSAVLELLKMPESRQPYNWAGFSLVGAQK